jgi:hypothetical protein
MAAPPIENLQVAVVALPPVLGLATVLVDRCRFAKGAVVRTLAFGLFLASLVAAIFGLDYARAFAPSRGGDAQIYCAATEAYDAGLSPYFVSNLRRFHPVSYSFAYPLHTLALFRPLCSGDVIFRFTAFYWACLGLAFLLSATSPASWTDRGLLAVLFLGGFAGAAWNFAIGNIGLVEGLGFAASYYCLIRHRLVAAALALGATASFKLLPVLFALSLAFLERPPELPGRAQIERRFRPVRLAVYAVLPLVISLVISYAMNPAFFHDFLLQLLGFHPNQHAPIHEVWPESNPVFLMTIKVFLSRLRMDSPTLVCIMAGVMIFMIGWLMTTLRRRGLDGVRLFSMGTLLLFLLMPRAKPYSFPYAVLPLFYLIREQAPSLQIPALLLSVWVPTLLFNARIMAVSEYLARGPLQLWVQTYQMGCLFVCALLLAIVYLSRTSRSVKAFVARLSHGRPACSSQVAAPPSRAPGD